MLDLKKSKNGPADKILVLITLASNEGSDQPAYFYVGLPEPLLLAYIKYGSRVGPRPKIRPLARLDTLV